MNRHHEPDDLARLGQLRPPLQALGDLLAAAGHQAHLVVVGGVAILLRGAASRATGDVDVIARCELTADGKLELLDPDPLPTAVQAAVARVARDFGLPNDWVNTVVGRQWRQKPVSLPPGLAEELSWYVLGGLHLGVAGRRALIALKLYAAVDTGPDSVHTRDLIALAPTDSELSEASRWVGDQDVSREFRAMLDETVAHVRSKLRP